MHQIALINPRRKRRAKKTRSHRRRRHVARRATRRRRRAVGYTVGRAPIRRRKLNPRRRRVSSRIRRYRRHRNPRLSVGGITRALIPAAIGGAGAVAVDIGVGYLGTVVPVPAFLQTGYGKVALQVAAAFGMGWLASKAVGSEKGRLVTMGALTVAAYGLVKNIVRQAAPTVPGLAGDGADNIGAYMTPGQLGYMNPAPMVNGFGAYMNEGAAMGNFDDGM